MQPSSGRWRAAHESAGPDQTDSRGRSGSASGAFEQGSSLVPGPGQSPAQVSATDAGDVARPAAHAPGRERPNGIAQTAQSVHDPLAEALVQLRGCTEANTVTVSAPSNRLYQSILQALHSALLQVCDQAVTPLTDTSQFARC
jgi:hypothetical protein